MKKLTRFCNMHIGGCTKKGGGHSLRRYENIVLYASVRGGVSHNKQLNVYIYIYFFSNLASNLVQFLLKTILSSILTSPINRPPLIYIPLSYIFGTLWNLLPTQLNTRSFLCATLTSLSPHLGSAQPPLSTPFTPMKTSYFDHLPWTSGIFIPLHHRALPPLLFL